MFFEKVYRSRRQDLASNVICGDKTGKIQSSIFPTGIPLVYELDETLQALNHYYLGDEEAIRKATSAVARQLNGIKNKPTI